MRGFFDSNSLGAREVFFRQFSGQIVNFIVVKTIDNCFKKGIFVTPNLPHSVCFTYQNIFYSYQVDDRLFPE